ncbi:ABC transporter ATP-binding protein [Pseudomarimonas salicorniae]|uniref:ABC transporter ATP-binding protein n=1 Tax=Pseudomarimonas salicorniae TaxID=2933270 RepID=A0ABT0GKI2_9GAMM|nr:ABC transporter ATP-binding protein [Lysobacter sp. CAU 1642]MCK7595041.1 ABC transporter ATP-binding protein [Lysobacter sp. CAU 1642]
MNPVLVLNGVRASYPGRPVLHDIDLQLPRGQWLALIGPNGTGKSTLLQVIAGLHRHEAGEVRIGGHCVASDPLAARRAMGFAPPPEQLPAELSGRQALELLAKLRGHPADLDGALALAERLQLDPWLGRRIAEYSFGTRQKLAALQALMGDPPLIVLDEVLNGLDPTSSWTLQQVLRERVEAGVSVLLSTHSLELAERRADRVALLQGGRIGRDWSGEALGALRSAEGGLLGAVAACLRVESGSAVEVDAG